jgi:endoglucanase
MFQTIGSTMNTAAHPFRLLIGTIFALALPACASSPAGQANLVDPAQLPPPPDGSPVALHGQLRVDGTVVKDQAGNPYQLKGVSSMWLNWEAVGFAQSRTALEYMRDNWKLSVIRAAMGTEASGGYIGNENSMRNKVEVMIQNAIVAGVYVLVDWHTEKAVEQKDAAIQFFTSMAQKYGGFPNVIWETYNEPAKVSWDSIKPYHEAVVDAIRAVDPDNLIVLGTPNWSQYVDLASMNPVNPKSGKTNLLYTLHFYSCDHTAWLRAKGDIALANGAALFVTEFGATPADGGQPGNNYICRDEAAAWFAWMAKNTVSGVAWKLTTCDDSSCILARNASADGPWTDDRLTTDLNNPAAVDGKTMGGGHGRLVVDWIRN